MTSDISPTNALATFKAFAVRDDRVQAVLLLSFTVVILSLLFAWQSHKGFSLADEGFLWYGAQRVLAGEVPMRDFFSYDLGRYYWSAAFMDVLGDAGIVALRAGLAVFQCVALIAVALALIRSCKKQATPFWILATLTMVVWMMPQFRLIDLSIPVLMISALAYLIEAPSDRRIFLAGFVVGLAAVFGRNHGFYGVIGSVLVVGYLYGFASNGFKLLRGLLIGVGGFLMGYLPVLLPLIFVNGFAAAYWDSVKSLFEYQATNIPLPVPWPWLMPVSQMPMGDAISSLLIGVYFIALLATGTFGIVWIIWRKIHGHPVPSIAVASIALVLPYAHYAYSRADLEHLALGMPPTLIFLFSSVTLATRRMKWMVALLVCVSSTYLLVPLRPAWVCATTNKCIETVVHDDRLTIHRDTAGILRELGKLAERYAPEGQAFLVAPYWPGAYAAMSRKAPMWEIYVSPYPRNSEFQRAEIERIANADPGFAVIYDLPLDGREDMRFSKSHALVDRYIRGNFKLIDDPTRPSLVKIYRREDLASGDKDRRPI
jgi:hypothetical protein